MSAYGVRDVQRLLHLSRATIRGCINQGLVQPQRGPRRAYVFSFQDVIVFRTVKALTGAKIPARRINRSIAALRRLLPPTVPLSGLQISAVGNDVIVREGDGQRHVESGQYLLALDVRVTSGIVEFVDRTPKGSRDAEALFLQGEALEDADPSGAAAAYQASVRVDPRLAAAWTNWGRLVHLGGELSAAEKIYRDGLKHCDRDPLLLFNLAAVLEDAGRPEDAIPLYLDAIAEDEQLADAHYNVARLYEGAGDMQAAIRHMACYRRLTKPC